MTASRTETSSTLDRIADFLADLPIGLIIFIIAMAFGLFGRGEKEQPDAPAPRQATRQPGQMAPPSVFASDERVICEHPAARAHRGRRELTTFGRLAFLANHPPCRVDEDDDRRDRTTFGFDKSEWGQTKYGFDESEWGSSFGERKNPDPIIR